MPDLLAELDQLADARARLRASVHRRLDTEDQLMAGLPQRLRRGVGRLIALGAEECERAVQRNRTVLAGRLQLAEADTAQLLARVVSLSPQAVLNRGYAVLWNSAGELVRSAGQAATGELLQVRVADGEFGVRVGAGQLTLPAMSAHPEPQISYEAARAELRDIVQALETGGQPLEESLSLWQRGEELAGICQHWLDGARARLDAAIAASDERG